MSKLGSNSSLKGDKPQHHVCFVCGAKLGQAWRDEGFSPVRSTISGGCFVRIDGGYGTTVFDPMNHLYHLAGAICDSCLVGRIDRLFLVRDMTERDTINGMLIMKHRNPIPYEFARARDCDLIGGGKGVAHPFGEEDEVWSDHEPVRENDDEG